MSQEPKQVTVRPHSWKYFRMWGRTETTAGLGIPRFVWTSRKLDAEEFIRFWRDGHIETHVLIASGRIVPRDIDEQYRGSRIEVVAHNSTFLFTDGTAFELSRHGHLPNNYEIHHYVEALGPWLLKSPLLTCPQLTWIKEGGMRCQEALEPLTEELLGREPWKLTAVPAATRRG